LEHDCHKKRAGMMSGRRNPEATDGEFQAHGVTANLAQDGSG